MSKKLLAAAIAALAAMPCAHAQDHARATSFSEPGDPPRWYVPADTPRRKYENAAREARNALADQIRECRASASKKECEAEARAQYRQDMARARDFLAPNRQLA